MAPNIQNPEAKRAVVKRPTRLQQDHEQAVLKDDLLAIGAHCTALPELDARPTTDILAYDQDGLPL